MNFCWIFLFAEDCTMSPSEKVVSSDPSRQPHILVHHCDPSCVYSQEDAVFEELCEVHLSRFLHRPQSVGLEAETLDPPLGRLLGGDLSDHPSEWQAWDQEVGRLLVLPDLHQSSGPRSVSVLSFLCSSWRWVGAASLRDGRVLRCLLSSGRTLVASSTLLSRWILFGTLTSLLRGRLILL